MEEELSIFKREARAKAKAKAKEICKTHKVKTKVESVFTNHLEPLHWFPVKCSGGKWKKRFGPKGVK